ncbi:MAG: cytochrome c oxidase subunit II [Chloroflexota bacterium]
MFLGPSNTTGKVETAFLVVVGISVALLVIVTVVMIFFLIRYNRTRHPRSEEVKERLSLEVVWTVVPLALVLVMFYFGWVDFEYVRNPPENAMSVNVTARQWSWFFEYENGRKSDLLRVPIGKPVKLILTSEDVIHSLYIPAFRIKEDCVPGMKTHLWFNARELGSYDIFCTEYCGLGHSHMRSKVIVVSDHDFDKWYTAAEVTGPGEKGLAILKEKGCLGCHSTDGSRKVGPTLKGILGHKVRVLTGGEEHDVTADEAYIKRSILHPEADVVKGYPPIMPTISLTAEELQTLTDYLKTLK